MFNVWGAAHLESCMFSSIASVDLAVHKPFPVKYLLNCHMVISGCVLHCVKVLDVNIEPSAWENAGTFKAKYAVNFKCTTLSVPFKDLILLGWQTILKGTVSQ